MENGKAGEVLVGNTNSYLYKIETVLSLKDKEILEVGCGEGTRTFELERRCRLLMAVDSDARQIKYLRNSKGYRRANYLSAAVMRAEKLELPDNLFDIVIYTLSFHHIRRELMPVAIDEARRVLRPDGHVIFLEPGFEGSCFEAERLFDCSDGDEIEVKQEARKAMREHPGLTLVAELFEWQFFKVPLDYSFFAVQPQKNLDLVPDFLCRNNYRLTAKREIHIFKAKR